MEFGVFFVGFLSAVEVSVINLRFFFFKVAKNLTLTDHKGNFTSVEAIAHICVSETTDVNF